MAIYWGHLVDVGGILFTPGFDRCCLGHDGAILFTPVLLDVCASLSETWQIKPTYCFWELDISKMLDIIIQRLRTNCDIFLQEIVSNTFDVCIDAFLYSKLPPKYPVDEEKPYR